MRPRRAQVSSRWASSASREAPAASKHVPPGDVALDLGQELLLPDLADAGDDLADAGLGLRAPRASISSGVPITGTIAM